ncbi:putative transmembrane protein, partial [Rhizoctonia solani 123E]
MSTFSRPANACPQAALFSAISTAFVIESYKSLKPDPADTSSQTLLTISQTLMLIVNGSQPTTFTPSSEAETLAFKPSAKAICVNVLWFLSLSLSVAVSLISMLAKEWCLEFMAGRTGPFGAQARRRQQRWDGLVRWRMKEVIMILPSLIHSSLLSFAIGLCVFLWDVHFGVAIPVVAVTALAASAYLSCTIVPLRYDFCPYGTVLSRFIKQLTSIRSRPSQERPLHDEVTTSALRWMIENCETPRSVDTALQSLAAADGNLPSESLDQLNVWMTIKRRFEAMNAPEQSGEKRVEQLYKRALEAHLLTRRKVDGLNYGLNNETRKLEQLVVCVQSTISGLIHEVISDARSLDPETLAILKRCTSIGRQYFLGRLPNLHGNQTYMEEGTLAHLAEELAALLEQYLKRGLDRHPVLYCVLSASFAFVMCCNATEGNTQISANASRVLRVVRAFSPGSGWSYSGYRERSFADYLILGTLWLGISDNSPAVPASSTPFPYAGIETALETLWAGLMSTAFSDRSALNQLDNTHLTRGVLYLITNPNRFNLTAEDSATIGTILYMAWQERHPIVKIQHRQHDQSIQDISQSLATMTDVAAFTPQLLKALYTLRCYAPWDDMYLLPTPDIYVFLVKSICMTSDKDPWGNWYTHHARMNAFDVLSYSPIPKCSTQLVEQLSANDIITHLTHSLASHGHHNRVFATIQLGMLFNMSLSEPDRSSPALNILEQALLKYPGLGDSLDRQEDVAEELAIKLEESLFRPGMGINSKLEVYACRVLEVMRQHTCTPLPEKVSHVLEDIPERLRGIKSLVNLETEKLVVYLML